ncbi:MAG TPA: 30S ribosomal protein S5 [Bacteroidetes bacterium]|nr:30S ribosomal protein S5 [Bacteroidota bacterium]
MERISPSELDLKERVVHLNRVAKVVKGGRNFSFNAIVVVGDSKGHVGVGFGKANEVSDTISKATENAKKNLVQLNIINGTIAHAIIGKYGAAKVMLKPAAPGTGVIAGGAVRAIMDSVGITNILTKNLGSTNPYNVVKATMIGLLSIRDAYQVAKDRNVAVNEVFS